MDVIDRVEPGAETERMSGTHSRGRIASGTAIEDAKAEVIGTPPGKEAVESRWEQRPRVESGTETESNAAVRRIGAIADDGMEAGGTITRK